VQSPVLYHDSTPDPSMFFGTLRIGCFGSLRPWLGRAVGVINGYIYRIKPTYNWWAPILYGNNPHENRI